MADGSKTQHFGRGGAGNKTKKSESPALVAQTTPLLRSENYTTGRGGSGNMAKLDPERPEEARVAQDVDVPGIALADGPRTVGRGGAANIYHPSEEEVAHAKANNEKLRRESFRRGNSGNVMKGLAEKGKELLKGKSDETRVE